mgnify:CR=1 FL=1
MKTITIRLTSPLQSYGNEASFNRRTSYHCPSKSAVIGMIGAALGYRRFDSRLRNLSKLLMAVRIDQPGQILTDFQIAEYHRNAKATARKLTYRDYLQDAVFVVALSSEKDDWLDQIAFALRHPKFQLFLGRLANVPAGPLKIKTFNNKNALDVLKEEPWQASGWYQRRRQASKIFNAEIIADAKLSNIPQSTTLVKDSFGSFDQKNRFHNYREVTTHNVALQNKFYQAFDTNHDAFSFIEKGY